MYKVEINIDPKLIGHGVLLYLIDNAIRQFLINQALENKDLSLVKVTYEGHKQQD